MTQPHSKAPDEAEKAADTVPYAQAPQPPSPEQPPVSKPGVKKPKNDAAKLTALEEKLAGAEEKLAGQEEAFKRLAAEYDNYRKRTQKEHDSAFSNGVAYAAELLLPVLDTLEAAAGVDTADEEYKKGVLLTLQKCDAIFEKLGIEPILAEGQPFNPELHNACMQEALSGAESGTVSRVVQKGYTLSGRVIRHAIVAVVP